jgi:hypothetical protein
MDLQPCFLLWKMVCPQFHDDIYLARENPLAGTIQDSLQGDCPREDEFMPGGI